MLGEIIGLRCRVVSATAPEYIGISGTVVDETMNTLTLETEEGVKKLPKKDIVLEFLLPSGEVVRIRGADIAFRPEERTKKLWRKKHAVRRRR